MRANGTLWLSAILFVLTSGCGRQQPDNGQSHLPHDEASPAAESGVPLYDTLGEWTKLV